MHGRFPAVATALAAAVAGAGLAVAPAAHADRSVADRTVVVPGVALDAGRRMQLSWLGCDDPYAPTGAVPTPMVGTGPGTVPAGERSVKLDLEPGRAVGALSWVDAVGEVTEAGLATYAASGSTGVAWVGYQAPADARTGRVWLGRAELTAPAGQWTTVDATGLVYDWTRWDLTTREPLDGEPVTGLGVADMVAAQGGDGPGFYSTGFGCDGGLVALDALRIADGAGATTYDLEGLTTAVTMLPPPASRLVAGGSVSLRAALADGSGAPLRGVTLMLESLPAGAEKWRVEQVVRVDGAVPPVTVEPEGRTSYRWRFADRPMATGSVSAPFTVEVRAAVTARREGRDVAGEVTPGSGPVVLWRRVDGTWRRAATTEAGPAGRFRFPDTAGGTYAVSVPGTAVLAAGRSAEVTVPAVPGATAEPSQPAEPAEPSQPAEPAEPAEEKQPAQPEQQVDQPSASPTAAPTPQPHAG